MKRKALIAIGLALAFVALQSCSSNPEKGLLQKYFNAVSLNDNDTMSSMALEPMQLDVASWKIVSVGVENVSPTILPDLNKKEAEAKKALEQAGPKVLDAKEALDAAQEKLDLTRNAALKATAKAEVDAAKAKYDEAYKNRQEVNKAYTEAKSAAAREEDITKFSLSLRGEVATIRDMTGSVHSKDVVVSITTKGGQTKEYKLPMRMYQVTDPNTGAKYNGRWVITRFDSMS